MMDTCGNSSEKLSIMFWSLSRPLKLSDESRKSTGLEGRIAWITEATSGSDPPDFPLKK